MISEDVLDAALRDLFERSPVPFSISTIDHNSRYIKVNPAYLRLVGRKWDEIDGQPLADDLPYSIDDPARCERMKLLETQGFYELAEVDMKHASGRIIPTLISAQRRRIAGESFDIEIIIDNSERKAFEQALLPAAQVDVMTGIQNRSSFEAHLRASLEQFQRECAAVLCPKLRENEETEDFRDSEKGGETLAEASSRTRLFLVYVDLNRFKRVNDRFGHSVGDRLLQAVARRLVRWSTDRDFVARLGGDEFAIVSLHRAGEHFSLARFTDLGRAIAEPITIDENLIQVGAAIGVAEASAGVSFDAFLDQADGLMYAAKSSGDLVDVRSELMELRLTGAGCALTPQRTQKKSIEAVPNEKRFKAQFDRLDKTLIE